MDLVVMNTAIPEAPHPGATVNCESREVARDREHGVCINFVKRCKVCPTEQSPGRRAGTEHFYQSPGSGRVTYDLALSTQNALCWRARPRACQLLFSLTKKVRECSPQSPLRVTLRGTKIIW